MTSFEKMHNDYLDPDKSGLFDQQFDNREIADAFSDYAGPGELYRSTYKYTDCGPSIGIVYLAYEEPDDPEGMGREVTRQLYGDDLYQLGTWADMDKRGELILAFTISSIVEGVEQCTDTITVEIDHENETAETIGARYWAAVEDVNNQANEIWGATHGCDNCRQWFNKQGWDIDDDDYSPIWDHCPECYGKGTIL
jgi:hypothetical protein